MDNKLMEEPKKRKGVGRIMYPVVLVILAIIILLAAGILVPRLFGVQEYAVVSGSMEPAIHVGSLVFVVKADAQSLENGDIIAYRNGNSQGSPIVHRVIANDVSDRELHTKGDANSAEDLFPVGYEQVLGKVVFIVPVIGRLFVLGGG